MSEIVTLTKVRVEKIRTAGGDEDVVGAARVMDPDELAERYAEPPPTDAAGLIRYMMRHRHGTPFEHALITVHVHAPLFVWREWMRHRWLAVGDDGPGMSFNEESGRYKEMAPTFWVPARDRKMIPALGHKSARPKFQTLDESVREVGIIGDSPAEDQFFVEDADSRYKTIVLDMRYAYETAYRMYRGLMEFHGVAKEVARAVLGTGIYSAAWVTCNPRSLFHFLSLRTHEPEASFVSYPQIEIEEAARALEEILKVGWPISYAAFCEFGRVAP